MGFYVSIAFIVFLCGVANLFYQADIRSKKIKESLTKNGIDFMRSQKLKQKLGYRIKGESLINYKLYVKVGRWLYKADNGKSGALQELIEERCLDDKTKPIKAQFGSFYS